MAAARDVGSATYSFFNDSFKLHWHVFLGLEGPETWYEDDDDESAFCRDGSCLGFTVEVD